MKYDKTNPPLFCMMTQGTCYESIKENEIKGILLCATKFNESRLSTFVQPNDNDDNYIILLNKIGNDENYVESKNANNNFDVNCWIGKLANGEISSVQTLPWNCRKSEYKDKKNEPCNNGWIQIKICKDETGNEEYFNAIYDEICEIVAYLCKRYDIKPDGICRYYCIDSLPAILYNIDTYTFSYDKTSSDVNYWFNKNNKTIEDVRLDVQNLLGIKYDKDKERILKIKALNEELIWDYLYSKINNAKGVAGLMGNLYAISNLNPNKIQKTYDTPIKLDAINYTRQVDEGIYKNFIDDSVAYGIAQWTDSKKKKDLLEFAKKSNVSIGDLESQLEFLYRELFNDYSQVLSKLRKTKNVKKASDIVLLNFEKPRIQTDIVKTTRTKYAKAFYVKYKNRKKDKTNKYKLYKVYTGFFIFWKSANRRLLKLSHEGLKGVVIDCSWYYKILVGTYINKINAELIKNIINRAGFSASIEEE